MALIFTSERSERVMNAQAVYAMNAMQKTIEYVVYPLQALR